MSVSRWIQCEECITEFGFLAKHPTTGNAIPSPYVAMSQSFMKHANNLWCFLKVLGMFVINFAAWYLQKYGKTKFSPQKLQKQFGNTTLVELLQLPHPKILIELLNVPLDYGQIIDQWVKKHMAIT